VNVATYAFRIVNVFAETPLGGNPLAVFEDARGLDADTMQALALQFNLSETTFLLPSSCASATVRIFTPTFEMPFAGHPTLGSAHVVRDLRGSGDGVTLEMRAGVIPVRADGDRWTLTANAPRHRAPAATRDDVLARFFFLKYGAIVEDPGTGSACANLGGWLLATNASLPQRLRIDQGEAVGRRCRLDLTVDVGRGIHVGGRVVELGRGTITL